MILNKKSNFKMKLDFLFILYFMIILKFIGSIIFGVGDSHTSFIWNKK